MFSQFLITLLFSVFSTLTFAQTFPTGQAVVPGCGDKKIKWNVTTDRSKHPISTPEPGKALVYPSDNLRKITRQLRELAPSLVI